MQVPNPGSNATGDASPALSAAEFRRRFRWLIFYTWNIPPVFGLGFILLIGVLTPAQILGILTTPLEPAYILGWLAFALWFLPRCMRPLADWLDSMPGSSPEQAVRAVRRFPLIFWATFLVYLVVAPASVIVAAEIYTDFVATPYDWFRIELVALIVSIIVGLPIFFRIFDLFGQVLGNLEIKRPIFTVRTKVFLIGALVPLLIDTLLVQYYWTRTGYFTFETFGVWLLLEALAIGGSLIFAHSFGQSLGPLQQLIGAPRPLPDEHIAALRPRSTDELGLLTADYRKLLDELQLQNEILELNNRLLRTVGGIEDTGAALTVVVDLCKQALGADQAFLIAHDEVTGDFVGVAQTGDEFRPDGHWRVHADEPSLARWVFEQDQTIAVEDMVNDPRVSARVRAAFGTQSSISTLIRRDGQKFGVLTAIQREQPRTYGSREIVLIESLAREAALALQTQQLRQARAQAEVALRDSEQRLLQQQEALIRLAEYQVYAASDIKRVLQAVTETVAAVIDVQRASVWRIDQDRNEIICLDLFERDTQRHSQDTMLSGTDYPAYFTALKENRLIIANDALTAKETREFGQAYLVPQGIGAMLDAPIHRAGRAIGVLCSEHVDGQRHWTTDEANFSNSAADFVSLCLELHDHNLTANELAHHREHLEELVLSRTAELETVNRELEAFSYSVSHDLRAPLRAIDGFARALSEDYADRLDDNGQDYLRRVRAGTQRMGILIDDMLQLSRVGRAELRPVEVYLSSVARDIVTKLALADPGRQVEVEISPGLIARGDPRLLHVMLTNLFDNAWKYTCKTRQARIEFRQVEIDGEQVFSVRDNGVGYDMQYADKLFGAFQRLHGAEFPGTGIGLATVARIITRHGGRVWAEAEPGKGATFYFTLAGAP